MTNRSPSSCSFTIGSAVHRKNTKKTHQGNREHMPKTCGTCLHKRLPVDVDIETARRAEVDRRADYDKRVETARRKEYDRRLAYDQRMQMTDQGKAEQIEDFSVQIHRLAQMGTMIDLLTLMFTKSSQEEAAEEIIASTPHTEGEEKIGTKMRSVETGKVVLECESFSIRACACASSCSTEIIEPQMDDECEDWSLHMTKAEEDALSALLFKQDMKPSQHKSITAIQETAAQLCEISDKGSEMLDAVEVGLGFHRAHVDVLATRKIVTICRRYAVAQLRETSDRGNKMLDDVEVDHGFQRAHADVLKTRKIVKILRRDAAAQLRETSDRGSKILDDVEVDHGFQRAHADVLLTRKIVKIRRDVAVQQVNEEENKDSTPQKEEEEEVTEGSEGTEGLEGTLPPTESVMGRLEANKERGHAFAAERARKWKSWCHNLEKEKTEKKEKVTRRLENECERRERQSKSFTWSSPVKLSGLSVQDNGKGLLLRWLEEEGKLQVLHEDGRLIAVEPENVIREETRGAVGKEVGTQRDEKILQKKRLRNISRIKRAGAHWKKRFPAQDTTDVSGRTQPRENKTSGKLARVLRTSELKRTKINNNNNNGRGKTPTLDHWRGVMSLSIHSTKRGVMKLVTMGTSQIRLEKDNGIRNYEDYLHDGNADGNAMVAKKGQEGKRSTLKVWWEILLPSRLNVKRKILEGSTDVYLLTRTIEIEID